MWSYDLKDVLVCCEGVWSCGLRGVAIDGVTGIVPQRVLLQINDLLTEELKRQRSADSQQRNELSVTLQRWRSTRRFFTGERGAWSSR